MNRKSGLFGPTMLLTGHDGEACRASSWFRWEGGVRTGPIFGNSAVVWGSIPDAEPQLRKKGTPGRSILIGSFKAQDARASQPGLVRKSGSANLQEDSRHGRTPATPLVRSLPACCHSRCALVAEFGCLVVSCQVFCSEFSPDGRALATGSFDKSIYLWNVGEQRERERGGSRHSGVATFLTTLSCDLPFIGASPRSRSDFLRARSRTSGVSTSATHGASDLWGYAESPRPARCAANQHLKCNRRGPVIANMIRLSSEHDSLAHIYMYMYTYTCTERDIYL